MHHLPEPLRLVPASPLGGVCLQLAPHGIRLPLRIPVCLWVPAAALSRSQEGGFGSLRPSPASQVSPHLKGTQAPLLQVEICLSAAGAS